MRAMFPSVACESIVKEFEGLYLVAYRCPAGILTIGYGHTKGVAAGAGITAEQAEAFLRWDLAEVARDLSAILPANLMLAQHQFDALCSLCFNLAGGARALRYRAPKLWRCLCDDVPPGEDEAAQFLDMDHALVSGHMEEMPGLKRRRRAEADLFLGRAA